MNVRAAVISALTAVLLLSAVTEARGDVGTLSPAQLTLSRCVQKNGSLDVLFLIDESKSLFDSDRAGRRADGLKAAVTGLNAFASEPVQGQAPKVSVSFASFAGRVDPDPYLSGNDDHYGSAEWSRVDQATLPGLLKTAESYRSNADLRLDTDFALALRAARLILAQHAREETEKGGAPPCKALVWFTDGQYKILDRDASSNTLPDEEPYAKGVDIGAKGGGAAVVKAGTDYLCDPNGLMDGLVDDGVVKFTVSLTKDNDLLRRLTVGGDCGTSLSEETGDYLEVDGAACLFFSFSDLLSGGECPEPIGVPRAFRTVAGLSGFVVRGVTGGSDVRLRVKDPASRMTEFRPLDDAEVTASATTLAPAWTSSAAVVLSATFDRDSTDWIGPWSYEFVDPGGSEAGALARSDLLLTSDLAPALTVPAKVVRGRSTKLTVALEDGQGRPAPAGPLARGAQLTARIVDGSGRITDVDGVERGPAGDWTIPVSVPSSFLDRSLTLETRAAFTVPGAPVADEVRTVSLDVDLPRGQGFPTVTPKELNLPSTEGEEETSGRLTITGDSAAGGCAWLEPGGGVKVQDDATTRGECVEVGKGERRSIKVTFKSDGDQIGQISKPITVRLRSDLVDRTETVRIPASFQAYPEPDIKLRIVIFIVVLLLALLIPVGTLYGLNWCFGTFTPAQQTLAMSKAVTVRPGIDVTADGGRALTASYDEFTEIAWSGTDKAKRKVEVRGAAGEHDVVLNNVPMRRPGDLMTGPRGRASARDHVVVAGRGRGEALLPWGRGHEVPHVLRGLWLFVPGPDWIMSGEHVAAVPGVLSLLIGPGRQDSGAVLLEQASPSLTTYDWARVREVLDEAEEPTRLEKVRARLKAIWRRATPGAERELAADDERDPLASFEDDDWGPRADAGATPEPGFDADADDDEDQDRRDPPRGGADF